MPGTPGGQLSPAAALLKERLRIYSRYGLVAATKLPKLFTRKPPLGSMINDYLTVFVLQLYGPVSVNKAATLLGISWATAENKLLAWEADGLATRMGDRFVISDLHIERMALDQNALAALDQIESAMAEAVEAQRALRTRE